MGLWVLVERMTNGVVKPVKNMTKAITQMASGDFTVSVMLRAMMRLRLWDRAYRSSFRLCAR